MAIISKAPVDKEGFLINLSDWSKEVAEKMAQNDSIKLTEEHWLIIYFLREYFKCYKIAPPIRVLNREVTKKLGSERGNSIYLYSLFPRGLVKQGCRFAGLPKPNGCI